MVAPELAGALRALVEVGSLVHGELIFKRLAMSGTYFTTPMSSFLAESLALEYSTLFVSDIVRRHSALEPLGKKPRI